MSDATEPLDHPEWYPADWDSAPPCGCGHGKYQHLPIETSTGPARGLCLFEADRPQADRCTAYRQYESLTFW